mmetsp:Transcript_72743/g.170554  ORF Transcript_72743/g.170554 Transcript_72743/m.170554 type:complete len:216 (-) Transcript_72743:865-1512(-)
MRQKDLAVRDEVQIAAGLLYIDQVMSCHVQVGDELGMQLREAALCAMRKQVDFPDKLGVKKRTDPCPVELWKHGHDARLQLLVGAELEANVALQLLLQRAREVEGFAEDAQLPELFAHGVYPDIGACEQSRQIGDEVGLKAYVAHHDYTSEHLLQVAGRHQVSCAGACLESAHGPEKGCDVTLGPLLAREMGGPLSDPSVLHKAVIPSQTPKEAS